MDGSRVASAKCDVLAFGRVQTSVRPVDAALKKTAGLDGVRELGPALLYRLQRLGHSLGCPGSRSDRFAIISLCAHNS